MSQGGFQSMASHQHVDSDLASARKRIILCCDGTWQSAVSGKKNCPSNVTLICRSLNPVGTDKDGEWQQVVWYDSGVGTTSGGLGPLIEGSLGRGLEGNVLEAYNFCVLNWTPGDQILCFGFSRGAYTARSIAGLIADLGICTKDKLHEFPELFQLYKDKSKPGKRFYGSSDYIQWMEHRVPADNTTTHGGWVQYNSRQVEVVGVFDTVGAIGVPSVHGYELKIASWWKEEWHNVTLSRNIRNAFQALAIDEHRRAFSPSVFYIPPEGKSVEIDDINLQNQVVAKAKNEWQALVTDKTATPDSVQKKLAAYMDARGELERLKEALLPPSKLIQVWFPGYHINVGGGSSETLKGKGDMEEMSSIALAWMLDQIKDFVSIDYSALQRHRSSREMELERLNKEVKAYNFRQKAQDALAKDSWGSWLYMKANSAMAMAGYSLTGDKKPPFETEYKWGWGGTHKMDDSYTLKYRFNGSEARTPLRYALDPTDKTEQRTLGDTYEFVHPTVGFRVKHFKGYLPMGLTPGPNLAPDAYQRRLSTSGKWKGKYEYVLNGRVLPEWEMEENKYSHERAVIAGKTAWDYVDNEIEKVVHPGFQTPRYPRWSYPSEHDASVRPEGKPDPSGGDSDDDED
ncbi:hypothetical protein ASPZODRAFT_139334 [Penicilliopsis zonata CBS 506.65]|uniref:T6SS Phospholipase effector Tle1-like catalytic domain-containing protein n=1 Tax=Penicilliopsis zonata CBS 506.65 TaxID=1073090 RepID=A0A1L9SSB4_9EURO|nr:hypothetical protein ASPZODRAFT_139334 [Penicilliopsis zonata CBS 506.65]OJJ49996.1 hypothetical protein ASPZODRAFT_139334 [Penicilliopsis zonata CBS 506.65]